MSKWCRPNSLWNRINQIILKYSSFSTKITMMCLINNTLQWHHNESDCVSNHQPNDCLLNRLFRHRWKKTSKLHVTGLCVGNSPVTSEFPAQRASNAENVSIWWCHHELFMSFFMKKITSGLSFSEHVTSLMSDHRNVPQFDGTLWVDS